MTVCPRENIFDNSWLPIVFFPAVVLFAGCGLGGTGYGKMIEKNGVEVYYTDKVTKDEADKLLQYLLKSEWGGDRKTIQLNKTGATYEFRMVIKKGVDQDDEFVQVAKAFALELSREVFGGADVDIHFCDEHLRTVRVVVPLR
ncbi:MAG: hypothetical protein KatS3mg105_4319 [Gemmatales bacterium]|nr:MAG: hypothetical protein KatS3mg105_4319 [Gemmatales bacterium]